MAKRHELNAPGDWFVDTSCIDCAAAREVAPGLIIARDEQSVFARQPHTDEELRMAWRARLLCPTASIHTASKQVVPNDLFPQELTAGIYRLGYNARDSFGAHAYLIRRPAGNVMVDSPRWTSALVSTLEAWGGLSDILLSHRDDVADAGRYAEHFGAHVWIHEWDRAAARFASMVIKGREPTAIAEDFLAIPVPGHTKGSVVYLYNRSAAFTGDSLAISHRDGDLTAFRHACWYSWPEQIESLRGLLSYSFEWVFAGHGGSGHFPAAEMRARLETLVERMAAEWTFMQPP
jgi:glyoxylase-like metal-dependent hydrolase (beta-lactamase superfamily II)